MNGIQRIGRAFVLGVATFFVGTESARLATNYLKQEVKETVDKTAGIAIEVGAKATSELIGKAVIKVGTECYKRRLEYQFKQEFLKPEYFKRPKEEPVQKPEKKTPDFQIKRPFTAIA